MKKTSIILLMVVLVNLISAATSYASSEFLVKDKTIIEYRGTSDNVVIPAYVDGECIMGIESGAFKDNPYIETVTIEEGVEFIAPYAFDNCDNLEEVICPDTIISVSPTSFSGCDSFWNLDASLEVLEQSAMTPQISFFAETVVVDGFQVSGGTINKYVGEETEVVIPSTINDVTITTISANAFQNNTKITSVQIPQTVTTIGKNAFSGCSALTAIDIPSSVTSIGTQAFYGCKKLTAINVGEANTKYCDIDGVLFNKDKSQIVCYPIGKTDEEYTVPNTVTTIGAYAFSECTALKSIVLQEGVSRMGGSYIFYYCSNLENISLPSTLQNIGVWAFGFCKKLSYVEIPYGVKTLDSAAFYYCSSLNNILMPDSVTTMGTHCFRACSSLNNIKISNSITGLYYRVFNGCGFSSIEIPDSVTLIDKEAFYQCQKLTNITIPNNVTKLGQMSFYGCISLLNVVVDGKIAEIGNSTFEGCSKLTSVSIPDSVTNIGEKAFYNCNRFTDVYYAGCKADWSKISIGASNEKLTNATIHYAKNNYSHEILTYSISNNSLIVNSHIENNTDLPSISILAVYDEMGVLKGVDTKTDYESPEIDFTIDNYTYADGDYAKLFMWSALTDIRPLIDAEHSNIIVEEENQS